MEAITYTPDQVPTIMCSPEHGAPVTYTPWVEEQERWDPSVNR